MRRTIATAVPPSARSGFTLVELLVVVVIIGIMAAMAVPSLQRAIEQSQADVAAANLRAIWAAERLYWLEYHAYTTDLAPHTPPQPTSLVDLGLLDAILPSADPGASIPVGNYWGNWYWYQVTLGTDPTSLFSASAIPAQYTGWTGSLTIDNNGTISGTVSGQNINITPGCQ